MVLRLEYHENEGRTAIGAIALFGHNSRELTRVPVMDELIAKHISKTPGVCGGRACIAGHRIRVMDIVVWHQLRGYSADEVCQMYPGINLADVYAALTYYFDNRKEIDDDFAAEEEIAKELMTRHPSKLPGKRSA